MYHLKSIVSRSAAFATKQQLSKFIPVTVLPSRNYADHQIPERLKDVAAAKGLYRIHSKHLHHSQLSIAFFGLFCCAAEECEHFNN